MRGALPSLTEASASAARHGLLTALMTTWRGYHSNMASYTRAEFQAFRSRQRRAWRVAFSVVVVLSAAVIVLIGQAGSYLAGLVAGAAIALVGFEVLRRWNRERWRRQFPELRNRSFAWSGDVY